MRTALCRLALIALGLIVSLAAGAQEPGALPGLVARPLEDGGQAWTLSVQTLVLLTAMAFLPAVLLMMTGFTRIIIVLSLLRSALATPTAPPNQVLLGWRCF
jgi:flagellar biosynthetic protein FliP